MAIFPSAFSNTSGSSSASTAFAVSTNRLYCSGSSGFASIMGKPYQPPCSKEEEEGQLRVGPWQPRPSPPVSGFLVRGSPTSEPVSQALPTEAFQGGLGTRHIVHPQPFAVAVPKIEFRQYRCRCASLTNPALQDAEVVLDGVGVRVAPDVFAGLVVRMLMLEVAAHVAVLPGIVGVQLRSVVDLAHHDRPQVRGGDARDVHGANAPVALDQGEHGFLAPAPAQALAGPLVAMPVLCPCRR